MNGKIDYLEKAQFVLSEKESKLIRYKEKHFVTQIFFAVLIIVIILTMSITSGVKTNRPIITIKTLYYIGLPTLFILYEVNEMKYVRIIKKLINAIPDTAEKS